MNKLADNNIKNLEYNLVSSALKNEFINTEGVKFYHDSLIKINIKPDRKLAEDILLTDPILKN